MNNVQSEYNLDKLGRNKTTRIVILLLSVVTEEKEEEEEDKRYISSFFFFISFVKSSRSTIKNVYRIKETTRGPL